MIVFPAYIIGSAVVQALYALGVLTPINNALMPITVWWLGLPAVSGILLIFGVVRKEMTLLTLAVIFHTKLWLDHDSGAINSIGTSQHDLCPLPSQYTSHGIRIRMEKSNCYNNSGNRHSNHDRRYCIQVTEPIHVSSKILVEIGGYFSILRISSAYQVNNFEIIRSDS